MNSGIKLKAILKRRKADHTKIFVLPLTESFGYLTGAMWRDFPSRYGDLNAVYKCFSKWQTQGIFEKILADLSMEANFQDFSIDSTIIKVHQDAGSKKRINRKNQGRQHH